MHVAAGLRPAATCMDNNYNLETGISGEINLVTLPVAELILQEME